MKEICLAVQHDDPRCLRWSAGGTTNLNQGKIRCKQCGKMIRLRHTNGIGLNVPHIFCNTRIEAAKIAAMKNGEGRNCAGTFRTAKNI